MRKLVYIFSLLLLACNSEDANDCFQTSGSIIQQVISISSFERILVHRDIELIIKDAPNYKVTIETGENLINDVEVEVIDGQLVLTDHNSCNYVRDYGITKIYVETPTLTEIRTSTQYDISSDGVLSYDTLNLLSEDYNETNEFTVGDFRLNINSNNLSVSSNNLSFYYINGAVDNLFVGFYAGAGRFEGENLIAQNVQVYHRGSNDMVINPQQSLTGKLYGTGDLISVNEPPTVDVERFYNGQLHFQ
ncbi:head GIN domain-containing protein [Winogradskyella thalassocola]|uniref:Putative auto-transporter adhesin, head GIN domain n=1 Tax=Winogradskyella thalassocola TaxID=262004 RepID=A0A1G8K1R7_9FLAO|nr:head GIN domain-containing protein [Winogradskyella thalassocola]SDI37358.1 Putative auto-transporter adhesin, head GIN domain [Winogradskyella thalassocola]